MIPYISPALINKNSFIQQASPYFTFHSDDMVLIWTIKFIPIFRHCIKCGIRTYWNPLIVFLKYHSTGQMVLFLPPIFLNKPVLHSPLSSCTWSSFSTAGLCCSFRAKKGVFIYKLPGFTIVLLWIFHICLHTTLEIPTIHFLNQYAFVSTRARKWIGVIWAGAPTAVL